MDKGRFFSKMHPPKIRCFETPYHQVSSAAPASTHLEDGGEAGVGDEVQEGRAGEVVHVGALERGRVGRCLGLLEVALQAGAVNACGEGGGEVVGRALRSRTHRAGGGLELQKKGLDDALEGGI